MSSSESPAQPARSCPSTTVNVSPCRRSSAVSPTHRSGWSPCRRTAATFLLISSSVSRKMCRRSECPTSTRRHPSSASIVGEISPVNAPWGSQWQFCAPSPTAEPPSTSATAASAVKGGHTTTSTPRGRLSPSRTDWASARASAKPPCIFQLPTTRGVRMTYPRRGASPPFRSLPPGIVAPAKPALDPGSPRTSPFFDALLVLDEPQRQVRVPLVRAPGDRKGDRVSADIRDTSVAERITRLQDVPEPVRSFDQGQALAAPDDPDELDRPDFQAGSLLLLGHHHRGEGIAAALGLVGQGGERRARLRRPWHHRGRGRLLRCRIRRLLGCHNLVRLAGSRWPAAATGGQRADGQCAEHPPPRLHFHWPAFPPGLAGGRAAGAAAGADAAPGLAGGGAPSGRKIKVARVSSARTVPVGRSIPSSRKSPRSTIRGSRLMRAKKLPSW